MYVFKRLLIISVVMIKLTKFMIFLVMYIHVHDKIHCLLFHAMCLSVCTVRRFCSDEDFIIFIFSFALVVYNFADSANRFVPFDRSFVDKVYE